MNRYKAHLRSRKWREIRQAKLQSAGHKCEWCGETGKLEVHHKHYNTLGNESSNDLLTLCQSCHWAADGVRTGDINLKDRLLEPRKKTKEERQRDEDLRPRKRKKYKKFSYKMG